MYSRDFKEFHEIMSKFSKLDNIKIFIERPVFGKYYYEDPPEERYITVKKCKYVFNEFSDIKHRYEINGYIAIDSSSYKIGDTYKGSILLLRGSIVIYDNLKEIHRLGPYIIHITKEGSINLLNELRKLLGLQPVSIIQIPSLNRIINIIRCYFEDIMKIHVLSNFNNYIIFINRSLTSDYLNNSKNLLRPILDNVFKNNNTLIGFSKYSTIRSQDGRPIHIPSELNKIGYIDLYDCIDEASRSKLYGKTYLAKFTLDGKIYRVDICSIKYSSIDILNLLYRYLDFWRGYPKILDIAHSYSIFRKKDIIALKSFILSKLI